LSHDPVHGHLFEDDSPYAPRADLG
jgi:hypothetical protein